MFLVRSIANCVGEPVEVLAECDGAVIKIIEKFQKGGKLLESVTRVPDYQTAEEYLVEQPEGMIYGKEEKEGE